MEIGTRVRAIKQIVENDTKPDPNAKPCTSGWVHAEPGDEGRIVHSEPWGNLRTRGCSKLEIDNQLAYTVGFERTGTATLVVPGEVVEIKEN